MAEDPLKARMLRLGVLEADLQERFARSSGPGGQNVNKVATAVTVRHRPRLTIAGDEPQARP